MTLVETYRPKDWDEVVGNEAIKTILQRIIENGTEQHMIFAGPPGSGKTTIARIFASKYLGSPVNKNSDHGDYREINASDERGIAVVTGNKIKKYCETRGKSGKKRILYLDEADGLTPQAQAPLRAIMEENQDNVIIILALNNLNKIKEDAILSRCIIFKYDRQPVQKLKDYLVRIAMNEQITFENNDIIDDIINYNEYHGDFRRMVNDTLQKLVGITHPVTKEDVPWIYRENYDQLITRMLTDKTRMKTIFFEEYKIRYIDPIVFLQQLFKQINTMSYELAKIFADVDYRIRGGADSLIQFTYLIKGLTYYEHIKD